MKFQPDEIVSVLREEIAGYRREMDVARAGRVLEAGDGIAQVFGLTGAMVGEMLQFEGGQFGQVFNLEESSVGAVIYGDFQTIREGQSVRATGRLLDVPAGPELLGRVVDPLGRPLDGAGPVRSACRRPVEAPAAGIAERQPVYEPLYSGVRAVDAMLPIGRGQRELIIGDRKTGKTTLAIDTIINQAGTGVVCVYVAVGQKDSSVAAAVEALRAHGAMAHTIVVSGSSSEPAPVQYVAPYSGCAIAEHFMHDLGRPTLVVYDDLTKHAAAYRQISLLLRRPPGREAYPGDVFYLHSRLLERACKLVEKYVIVPKDAPEALAAAPAGAVVYAGPAGRKAAQEEMARRADPGGIKVHRLAGSGGSMTALPICETLEGEIASYIPTNLISITDGQIYLEPGLFFAGVRPAINVGISVSRVGYKAACPAMKTVAGTIRLDLAAYRDLERFAQLGVELDAVTRRQLDRGQRLVRLLTQPQHQPQAVTDQVIAIFVASQGFLDDLPLEEVWPFEAGFLAHLQEQEREFYDELAADPELPAERQRRLKVLIRRYKDGPYQQERRARRRPPDRAAGQAGQTGAGARG